MTAIRIHCSPLHCTRLWLAALHYDWLHCTPASLHSTALCCTALPCTPPQYHSTPLQFNWPHPTVTDACNPLWLHVHQVLELESALARATAEVASAKQAQVAINAELAVLRPVLRRNHLLPPCECTRCGGKCFGKVLRYRKCSRCENNRCLDLGPVETRTH